MEFLELLQTGRPVLLDGGMGTMLQAKGLPVGATPELTALEHPEWLLDIHRAYVEAGAQILYANTFGANREKLSHCGRTVEEIVPAAVALARPGPLALRLTECRFRGADTLTRWVTADGTALDIPLRSPPPWPVGHTLHCRVDLSNVIFYPDEEVNHG